MTTPCQLNLVLWFAAVAATWHSAPPPVPIQKRVLVLTSARGEAYGAALSGLRSSLAGYAGEVEVVELTESSIGTGVQDRVDRAHPDAVIAFGTKALSAAAALPQHFPIVATMMFRSESAADLAGPQSRHGQHASVSLDLPLTDLLTHLKRLLPSRTRAGMIRNPSRPGPGTAALRAEAKHAGFTLVIRDCDRTDDLLRTFLSFRDEVDFVWCPPESTLFNGSTIKPLVLASIRSGLPIVGFSENFVRAGAAVGVYPDYEDVGRQTGEVTRLLLERNNDQALAVSPRLWRVALNGRVAQMLGLHYAESSGHDDNRFQVLR
ncbi:ABC transporter substrate-binding protein [Paludibaculum fermentans]|uniref:ABC transporter substrate-binding protein n=1 Tax=Paludibaculum fermentans TaxID=1473598 RepID=A0A7S7NXE2_PALFE|nr:ABC transporter substrate binding protein [Paludibaculum fermentans]QOY91519.1 hypothetical protein IRI77_16695 [Paludibaculum fermentans]